MSIIKNVSGPYTINTINHDDPITLDSNRVIINGQLTVIGDTFLGNINNATVENTSIEDNTITLNKGGGGASGSVLPTAGIEVDRKDKNGTGLANVYVVWNETTDTWQATKDGILQNIIATTTGYTKLNEDLNPTLSANLTTGPNWIVSNTTVNVSATSSMRIESNLALKMIPATPPSIPFFNVIHGGNVAAGGTGVYVTTGEADVVGEELISKKRAIVYSIIF